MHGSTPAGLNEDGLRGLNGDGPRLQAVALALENRPAASYYTPQALKAEGLRWQGLAGAYARPQIVRNGGFDWSDAVIGAVGGLGFAMAGAALLIGARRMRRTEGRGLDLRSRPGDREGAVTVAPSLAVLARDVHDDARWRRIDRR